ncbi:hypothetical protein [Deinococcus roseus]|uniref:Uncharacterized protein n=1 Tax=Deinococcus roseus TaxID=392414 RepID=A0ABQ2CW70_9DEIO|nr:hypothetical protein [Deinococcus roseus]GGJ20124.1 hypothetical protein GCM10008938_02860 [Deinococcus roseus]
MHNLQMTFPHSQQRRLKRLIRKLTRAAQQEGHTLNVLSPEEHRPTFVLQIQASLEAIQNFIRNHFSFTFKDALCSIEIRPI